MFNGDTKKIAALISFFRIFDPIRLIGLFLIFLALRLPMVLKGTPLLVPELSWMLVGERMAGGGVLYKDIWFQLEPFAAGFYCIIDFLFGKSQLTYQLINIILLFFQALIFNLITNFNNVYNDRSYIPSLMYLLFSSLFFDFATLSPVVMGMTFLLPAFNLLLIQLRTKENEDMLLYIGMLSGTASLFYLSLLFFPVFVILVLVLYIHPPVRLYFTMLTGFFMPFMLVACFYFLKGGLSGLYMVLGQSFFEISIHPLISISGLVMILLPVAIICAASLLVISNKSKYINFQYLIVKVLGVWFFVGGIFLCFVKNLEPYHLMMFVIPLSMLASHYFLILKNKLVKEISFLLLAISIILLNYGNVYGYLKKHTINYDHMIVKNSGKYKGLSDKKILVLGNEPEAYLGNKMATPYYSWQLASKQLTGLQNYYNMSEIYKNFSRDLPEVIIDQHNIVPGLFYRLPALEEKYVRQGKKNIYIKNAGQ
jgi:hypothetical protein